MDFVTRKRNRRILVCNNCRLKKNKCDRSSPCSSCVRLGLHQTCKYGNHPEQRKYTIPDELGQPRDISLLVKHASSGQIPYKSTGHAMSSIGFLFPYIPIGIRDPGMQILWNHWLFRQSDSEFNQFTLHNSTLGLDNLEIARVEAVLHEKFPVENLSYKQLLSDTVDISALKAATLEIGRNCGFQYIQCAFEASHSLEKIKHSLPPAKVILFLLEVFFRDLAIYIPVLDEFDYYENLERLFNVKGSEYITNISVRHKQDYAIIAQILLVLRFAWLQVLFVSPDLTELIDRCEFAYKISVEIVNMANECIKIHGIYSLPSIALLQALILMLEYGTVAPEVGEGSLKNQALRGIILEIAYTLGLNREPKSFALEEIDQRTCHLRRKIWFHVFKSNTMDSCNYINQRRPLIHDFNTSWPSFEVGLTNFKNPVTEKTLLDVSSNCEDIIIGLSRLLDTSQRLNDDVDLKSSIPLLLSIEHILVNKLGSLKEIMAKGPGPEKILSLQTFVSAKMYIASFLYMAFVQRGNTESADLLPFTESCFMVYSALGQITTSILDDYQNVWGSLFKLVIIPTISVLFNFIASYSIMLSVRVKCTILTNIDNEELCCKLNYLLGVVRRYACSRIRMLHQLSTYNCFNWKVSKLHILDLNTAFNDSIYSYQTSQIEMGSLKVTVDDVDDLIKLCQRNIDTLQDDNYSDNFGDNTEPILSRNLLNTKHDFSNNVFNEDLIQYVQADQLWMARTILKLYEETKVPTEQDNPNCSPLFKFRDLLYTSVPRYRGTYGLTLD